MDNIVNWKQIFPDLIMIVSLFIFGVVFLLWLIKPVACAEEEVEEELGKGVEVVKEAWTYAYKFKESSCPNLPVTSWCMAPYGYVSDPDIACHMMAFIVYTEQDKSSHRYVTIDLLQLLLRLQIHLQQTQDQHQSAPEQLKG